MFELVFLFRHLLYPLYGLDICTVVMEFSSINLFSWSDRDCIDSQNNWHAISTIDDCWSSTPSERGNSGQIGQRRKKCVRTLHDSEIGGDKVSSLVAGSTFISLHTYQLYRNMTRFIVYIISYCHFFSRHALSIESWRSASVYLQIKFM